MFIKLFILVFTCLLYFCATEESVFLPFWTTSSLNKIIPNLFLGNIYDAANLTRLKEHNITHIVPIGNSLPRFFKGEFIYYPLEVDIFDSPKVSIIQYFEDVFTFIDNGRKGGSVFIHCQAGISRSASFVIAYVMKEMNLDFNSAFTLVKNQRSVVNPNLGFVDQLVMYQNVLKEKQ